MKPGQIWIVTLPLSAEREQSGQRPAIVIQDVVQGQGSPLILAVPLTSQPGASRFPAALKIERSETNGLLTDSVALVFQARALDRSRFVRLLGELPAKDLEAVYRELDELLGRSGSPSRKGLENNVTGIFKRLDHVSIGVKDMAKARRFFSEVLGGEPLGDAGNSSEGFSWATFRLGGKKVEVVSPTQPDGGVGRYIEKYGEGFHHISISVENLKEAIRYFEKNGVRVLGVSFDNPHWRHCYLHPADTFGALIQVFEENETTRKHAE